jgi:glycine/D-amino acid oxidase-like deaminating enzyme
VHTEKISHIAKHSEFGISFVYVTERPYIKDGIEGSLLTIGDPDSEFNHELVEYSKDIPFNRGVQKEMERFLALHYDIHTDAYERFLWHGLMGYTSSYARLVGVDPHEKNLYYNLGCNGVGILLSVWGARRLSQIFLGEELLPTMFDPDVHFAQPHT